MPVSETLARVYVDDIDTALPMFVDLTGEQPRPRVSHRGVEIVRVGNYLLLTGSEEALSVCRGTHATSITDSMDRALRITDLHGGEIVDGPAENPVGRSLTVRYPGGAIIEYVEIAQSET
ncbi:hypothetical protein ACFRKB_06400 [Streptomyces scopuliridis]|uniref:hypothetical protein n=1 Tax=Streptomyces scopuliridis TaxID=452529 RepID=UPI00369DBE8E